MITLRHEAVAAHLPCNLRCFERHWKIEAQDPRRAPVRLATHLSSSRSTFRPSGRLPNKRASLEQGLNRRKPVIRLA